MSEELDPLTTVSTVRDISRRSILVAMAVIAGLVTVISAIAAGRAAGIAAAIGGGLSFLNFFWLDRSTKAIFATGEGASSIFAAARYLLRYAVVGGILWSIHSLKLLPIEFVIAGLSAFVLAVVFEGFKNIFRRV